MDIPNGELTRLFSVNFVVGQECFDVREFVLDSGARQS